MKESQLSPEQRKLIIPSTWNVVWKDVNNKSKVKARLCARGDKETTKFRTDSPTVSKQALRILISFAATKKQKLKSLDFTGAYLQGSPIERQVFICPPKDVREIKKDPDLIWKTVRRLYGFKDSSRGWFLELDKALKSLGGKPTLVDPAMYVFRDEDDNIEGLAGVHVDDILYTGSEKFEKEVIKVLISRYVIGRVETDDFTFTGWSLRQDDQGISLTQSHYLSQLELDKFEVFSKLGDSDNCVLPDALQELFRSAVGVIQWMVQVSRADKAYYAVSLASKLTKASVKDAKMAYKQIKSMMQDPQTIMFKALGDWQSVQLRMFADSSWAKLHNCETVNANICFLVGNDGKSAVLDWQSNKLPIPAASPLTGEATAALDAYCKIPWLRSLLSDMTGVEKVPAVLLTDSNSLKDAVQSSTTTKDKRALVSIATIRRVPEEENIKIAWVSSSNQLADCLTKPGVNPVRLRQILSEGRLDITIRSAVENIIEREK